MLIIHRRTIAVGGNVDISTWERSSRGESCSPTGSSNGTLRRRVKTFDAGVQVKDYDFPSSDPVPVLQIVEGVEFGVQVDTNLDEPMKAPPRKKHAGTMAKPVTSDVGMFHKVVYCWIFYEIILFINFQQFMI